MAAAKIDQAELADWLERLGRDEDWLTMKHSRPRRSTSGVSRKFLPNRRSQKELGPMQLNLTRFELETVEVDSRDAAAEVVACVRNDGMEMSEVAEESRYPFHRSEVLLEDISRNSSKDS